MQYACKYESPLGGITLATDDDGITGIWFDGQKYFPRTLSAKHTERPHPLLERATEWLDIYFSGRNPGFDVPLHMDGSPFRTTVWNILLRIPYGRTVTYGDIAREIARQQGMATMSAQAVGGAVGRNPVSIIVPCHRVVGSGGSLTGYAGGLWRKERLLALERTDTAGLFIPGKGTAL